jgi:hypothetical protein
VTDVAPEQRGAAVPQILGAIGSARSRRLDIDERTAGHLASSTLTGLSLS